MGAGDQDDAGEGALHRVSPWDEPTQPARLTEEAMARGLFLRGVEGHVEFRAIPPDLTAALHPLPVIRLAFAYGSLRDFRERVGAPKLP